MINFLSRLRKPETVTKLAAEYYFGPGLKARGKIKTDSDIYLDCDYEGELVSQGVIEIDTNAHVQADLSCRSLRLSGQLAGSAKVKEQATILANADYSGELNCTVIEINQGALIDGQIRANTRAN